MEGLKAQSQRPSPSAEPHHLLKWSLACDCLVVGFGALEPFYDYTSLYILEVPKHQGSRRRTHWDLSCEAGNKHS